MTLACGKTTPTEPDLPSTLVAVPLPELYLSSPQRESRELLIDGRATDIEWEGTGDPAILLMRGDRGGGGGDFYASVRTLWSFNPLTNDSVALYFLIQWADPHKDVQEQPFITDIDWQDDNGNSLIDCSASDALIQPVHWRRSDLHEDQVTVELYSDANGSYPADMWRWGAGTTDPLTPVNSTEFTGAAADGDTLGQTAHPSAGVADDFYSTGGGWVPDDGLPFRLDNFTPGSTVPLQIANKGSRDVRLNRGKPLEYVIWGTVSKPFQQCDSLNPARLDDPTARDKTWNPGDMVPSYTLSFPQPPIGSPPSSAVKSQLDVLAKGGWDKGKWSLELRRLLIARPPDVGGVRQTPWPDDVKLYTGHTYGVRITIYDASHTVGSASALVPLYIKPRS
ncbi:MAG: hypothetical protein ACM3JJ_12980 [Hyphomicrobiales bacterium]